MLHFPRNSTHKSGHVPVRFCISPDIIAPFGNLGHFLCQFLVHVLCACSRKENPYALAQYTPMRIIVKSVLFRRYRERVREACQLSLCQEAYLMHSLFELSREPYHHPTGVSRRRPPLRRNWSCDDAREGLREARLPERSYEENS